MQRVSLTLTALRPVEIPSSINGRPVLLQDRCSSPKVLGYVAGPDGRLYARKVC